MNVSSCTEKSREKKIENQNDCAVLQWKYCAFYQKYCPVLQRSKISSIYWAAFGNICEIPFNKCVRGHRPIISAAIKMWKIRWKHFFLNLVEETGWRIWRQHQLLDLRKSFRTACTFNEGGTLSKMTSSLSGTTHLCLNICKQNSVPRTLHWIHVQFGHSNEWTLLVLTLF